MWKVGSCVVPLHYLGAILSPEIIPETSAKISSGLKNATCNSGYSYINIMLRSLSGCRDIAIFQ